MKHIVKLLTTLGIPSADADKLIAIPADAPEAETDALIEGIHTALEAKNKEIYQGDKEHLDAVRKEKAGRVWGEYLNNGKKAFGLTPEEMKEVKTDADLFAAIRKKMEAGAGDHVKTINDLRAELANNQAEIEKLNKEVIPGLQTKAQQDFEALQTTNALKSYIRKFKLVADNDFVVNGFADSILKSHKVTFNEAGDIQVLNSDGTKIFDGKEERGKNWFVQHGETVGVFAKSNGNPDPANPKPTPAAVSTPTTASTQAERNAQKAKDMIAKQQELAVKQGASA